MTLELGSVTGSFVKVWPLVPLNLACKAPLSLERCSILVLHGQTGQSEQAVLSKGWEMLGKRECFSNPTFFWMDFEVGIPSAD